MAKKPPIDMGDVSKVAGSLLKKFMKNAAPAKTRYNIGKDVWKHAGPSSPYPRPRAEDVASMGTMGGKTVKGPKGPVPKRQSTVSLKGKSIPKTEADKRSAERAANRLLRMNAEPKAAKKAGPRPKIDPDFPKVPKRSKSKPKPPRSATEADQLRREMMADLDRFGRGQRKPKPKKKP